MSGQVRRNQRYRARQAHGVSIAAVPIDTLKTAEALICSGRLRPAQTLERRAVEAALAEIIQQWAEHWREERDA